ncbi:MAG: SpoIIE family protein phosphatase [Flavobacteriales bacterium]
MKLRVIWGLVLALLFCVGQTQVNVDSLQTVLQNTKGADRLKLIEDIAFGVNDPILKKKWGKRLIDEAKEQGADLEQGLGHHYIAAALSAEGDAVASNQERYQAIEIFKSINRKDKMARQYLSIGNNLADLGLYDSALAIYSTARDLAQESNDSTALSGAFLNISTIYHERGEGEKELEYLIKASKLAESMQNHDQHAVIIFNIGVFYLEAGDQIKAVEQLHRAMALYRSQENLYGEASCYTFMAQMKFEEDEFDSAMHYLDMAAENYRKVGDMSRMAYITLNQGQTLAQAGDIAKAETKLRYALQVFRELGENHYIASALQSISNIHRFKGEWDKAISTLEAAIHIMEEMKVLNDLWNWYKELAELYDEKGDYKAAYEAMEMHSQYGDSLQASNKQEAIQEMEAKYQNEMKQLEIENLEKEKSLQQARLEREASQRMLLIGGLIVALILIVLVGYGFIIKQRDNRTIRAQKDEVETQRDEIQWQHTQLEEKNCEITDSITYAKRIQDAILPPLKEVKAALGDCFVLYKPKDIVAGDFYWLHQAGDQVIFAVADCTGHGVPGAMVSVVCHNALNRAVREFGFTKPSQILDKTLELVVQQFAKNEAEIKDGMDIALCTWNRSTNDLQYAGANNPLWIVRQDAEDVEEYKATKQPIGKYANPVPYDNNELKLSPGDSLYVFSDGFPDQFGGINGKKLKSKAFKELLLAVNLRSMDEQRLAIDRHFEDWRGQHEQIDDVCVIGLRVS